MIWNLGNLQLGTTIYEDIKRVYSCCVQFYQSYGSHWNQYCKVIWVNIFWNEAFYVCGTFSSLIDIYINSKLYKTIQFSTNNSIIFSHELNGSCCHTHRKYWSITLTWQHEVLTRTHNPVLIVNWSSVQNCRDCYIISNININRVDGRHQLDSVQTFHHYLLF